MDFKDVYDYVSNTLSIEDTARMPWHDVSYTTPSFRFSDVISFQVHMTLYGNVVLDISQHFVERWNEIKKRKVYYYPCSYLMLCSEPLPPSVSR
jgi:phospholipase D1/2